MMSTAELQGLLQAGVLITKSAVRIWSPHMKLLPAFKFKSALKLFFGAATVYELPFFFSCG